MSRTRSHGVATITALFLIAIVGATFAALATLFTTEVKRSAREQQTTQLRELLRAGESAASEALARGPIERIDVKLPPELESAGFSLRVERIEAATAEGPRRVRVRASAASVNAISETVSYAKFGGTWQVQAAELD
jgi:hypothetical protein